MRSDADLVAELDGWVPSTSRADLAVQPAASEKRSKQRAPVPAPRAPQTNEADKKPPAPRVPPLAINQQASRVTIKQGPGTARPVSTARLPTSGSQSARLAKNGMRVLGQTSSQKLDTLVHHHGSTTARSLLGASRPWKAGLPLQSVDPASHVAKSGPDGTVRSPRAPASLDPLTAALRKVAHHLDFKRGASQVTETLVRDFRLFGPDEFGQLSSERLKECAARVFDLSSSEAQAIVDLVDEKRCGVVFSVNYCTRLTRKLEEASETPELSQGPPSPLHTGRRIAAERNTSGRVADLLFDYVPEPFANMSSDKQREHIDHVHIAKALETDRALPAAFKHAVDSESGTVVNPRLPLEKLAERLCQNGTEVTAERLGRLFAQDAAEPGSLTYSELAHGSARYFSHRDPFATRDVKHLNGFELGCRKIQTKPSHMHGVIAPFPVDDGVYSEDWRARWGEHTLADAGKAAHATKRHIPPPTNGNIISWS